MRDPTVALYVVCALLIGGGVVAVSRIRGRNAAFSMFVVQIVLAAFATLALPLFSWRYPDKGALWTFVAATAGLLVCVALAALHAARPLDRLTAAIARRPHLASAILAVVSVTLLLAGLEFAGSSLTRAGLVRRYTPTETRIAQETEDWRLAHIMSDEFREPDPVLLWRPVARAPYTSQRFRGPLVTPEKPAGTVRIICYGDSNTDGPLDGGAWPAALADILADRPGEGTRYEVLNAGVTGYSSYQGLRRIEQEIDVYRPDVVLFAFGWNDAAASISAEDKVFALSPAFQRTSPWFLFVRRALFRYDAVLVALRLASTPRTMEQATSSEFGPRVSIEDYADNLSGAIERAAAGDAAVVLLTRPHRESEAELMRVDGWRRRVPAYNDTLRGIAEARGVTLVDTQRALANQPDLFVDGAHVTAEGHRRMAQLVFDRMVEAGLIR